ncbi:glutathione S-transferase T3-like [Zingiber officinale]|uniref:glutathione S-transferase T3-like n=1 Tax=Zingiber officinale TaxID=94328 RepID=UPI001C4B1F90|nr:glutathione S-transferase T3-like [Zingiber officinale]XP_042407693.1 glutathione S-transferase T3-like [Zingiber officinale]XP_042407694.1 glutathione S-transferase T3-like [Zingiber officinale]
MDENLNTFFTNLLNSSNTEGNSSSQNTRIPPNIQYPHIFSHAQYPPNVQNISYVPQYSPKFPNSQSSQNFLQTWNPSNAAPAPFGMYPSQDLSTMGSQLGMPYPYVFSLTQPPVIHSNESRRATIDPSISDKESLTPSSVPPHSSQEEREVELEENESKRRIWSLDEDVVLAKSWATINTDAIIGNGQKDQAFWKRIADYYNKHRPTGSMTRSYQRLKSHYYRFAPMVNEFFATYNNFYTHRQSAWSDENVLENALNMWKANNKGKDFKYMHVWRVLKEYEKYTPQSVAHYSNKKARTSESGENTSTSNPDTSVDLDDSEVRIRPIGQKEVKRKGKSKVREGNTMKHSIDKE